MHQLPAPRFDSDISLEECLRNRRSIRQFSPQELSDRELSQLLWAAQGITDRQRQFRTAPSAGATYPLELYVVTGEGIFHYLVRQHALRETAAGDYRENLAQAALGQSAIASAPAVIAITAVYERTTQRYGGRGEQYVLIEVGHAAQNIHLQAVGLGLASVPIGAFYEDRCASVLNLSSKEKVLYLIPVGRPPK